MNIGFIAHESKKKLLQKWQESRYRRFSDRKSAIQFFISCIKTLYVSEGTMQCFFVRLYNNAGRNNLMRAK